MELLQTLYLIIKNRFLQMKKKAFIIAYRFFDFTSGKVKIGGIQTYILDLSLLLVKMNYETEVIVMLENKKELYGYTKYKGFSIREVFCPVNMRQTTFDSLYRSEPQSTLFVVITIDMKIKVADLKNVITIQHGISWDFPVSAMRTLYHHVKYAHIVRKIIYNIREVRKFLNVSNMVCVDYNYVNWLRTFVDIPENKNVRVIPNYASNCISEIELEEKIATLALQPYKRIVFARRMEERRGTKLFANVVKRLKREYPDLEVTFAGDGALTEWVKNELNNVSKINFTTFECADSINFHKNFDIAVVPTIFSEGTSLSLCEAMAAGCYPIATFVGGLSNILIDGYNGSLCYPNEEDVYLKVKEILDMPQKQFSSIVRKAYHTYKTSFSKEKWELNWRNYIMNLERM